jgi:hypothetical protein
MIICNQCGNSLAEGHSFCTECGTVVPVSSAPAAPPPATTSFVPTQRLTPPYRQESQPLTVSAQSGPNPTPWIITSVVILLAAAVIIYQSSKPDTTSSATSYNSNSSTTSYNSGRVDYGSANASRPPRAPNMNVSPAISNTNPNPSSQNWTLAYCNANSLNVRSAPVLDTSKSNQVGELKRGDQVYIMSESSNYDVYNGVTSNWAQIRTVNGALHGWVFRYYLAAVDETGD